MKSLRFASILVGCIVANLLLFEYAGDSSYIIEKELQFLQFVKDSSLPILNGLAEYIHRRAPWLEAVPYEPSSADSRLATWYLPPQQVVSEWIVFIMIFVATLAFGSPRVAWSIHPPTHSRNLALLFFQLSLWTLVAVVYFKIRAWVQLGERFALLYLLQPCHVLIAAYTLLGFCVLKTSDPNSVIPSKTATLFHVLFDLQWFTWVAIALPDMTALLERDFFGEFFLFYFEHVLLIILPYMYLGLVFFEVRHRSWRERLHRAMHSLAWFGLHHIQVMTPVSLVSGVQVNYQTHLPVYALPWFGRAYKSIITFASFVLILMFAFVIDPVAKSLTRTFLRAANKKDAKVPTHIKKHF